MPGKINNAAPRQFSQRAIREPPVQAPTFAPPLATSPVVTSPSGFTTNWKSLPIDHRSVIGDAAPAARMALTFAQEVSDSPSGRPVPSGKDFQLVVNRSGSLPPVMLPRRSEGWRLDGRYPRIARWRMLVRGVC